jgi:hypothetical protein
MPDTYHGSRSADAFALARGAVFAGAAAAAGRGATARGPCTTGARVFANGSRSSGVSLAIAVTDAVLVRG